MKEVHRLANQYIWKQLVIRGGLLDEHKVSTVKPIESVIYNIVRNHGRNRWRYAMPPLDAMDMCLKYGVPLKFMKDNIGIIARNFIWEKSTSWTIWEEPTVVCVEDYNSETHYASLGSEHVTKSMSLNTEISKGFYSQWHMKGKEVREIKTTERMGVVWSEIVDYWNYVSNQEKNINKIIKGIK